MVGRTTNELLTASLQREAARQRAAALSSSGQICISSYHDRSRSDSAKLIALEVSEGGDWYADSRAAA
jgi:hypothetical protein